MQKHLKQPWEAQVGTPQLTVIQNREAIVEGCVGVLRYDEKSVRLNCETLVLNISGFDLQLQQLSERFVCVRGRLLELEFCEI